MLSSGNRRLARAEDQVPQPSNASQRSTKSRQPASGLVTSGQSLIAVSPNPGERGPAKAISVVLNRVPSARRPAPRKGAMQGQGPCPILRVWWGGCQLSGDEHRLAWETTG